MFLEPRLHAFAEKRTIWQHNGGTTFRFEDTDDECEEEVGGLAGLEMFGEVALDAIFLAPAERRIGENDVHAITRGIADIGPRQGVVVAHEAGILNAVQQHIGYTKHVRQLFFFDGSQGFLHALFILYLFDVAFTHVAKGTSEESAGAAGWV